MDPFQIFLFILAIIYLMSQARGGKKQAQKKGLPPGQKAKPQQGSLLDALKQIEAALEGRPYEAEQAAPPPEVQTPTQPQAQRRPSPDDFHGLESMEENEFHAAGSFEENEFHAAGSFEQNEFHAASKEYYDKAFEAEKTYDSEYERVDLNHTHKGALPPKENAPVLNEQTRAVKKQLSDPEKLKEAFLINELLTNPAFKNMRPRNR